MSVNLVKGQKISLSKEGGAGLKHVCMGLGWDVAKKKGLLGMLSSSSIDLDASCILFDEPGNLVDNVWFAQLKSKDGSIQHSGDNRTGAGEGDDEQIRIDLSKIPANIKTLVFTVNSFQGQNFSEVENAFCRLFNMDNNQEIARYNLSSQGNHTGQIMAKLYLHQGEWKMHAIGENTSGRTFQDMLPQIRNYL